MIFCHLGKTQITQQAVIRNLFKEYRKQLHYAKIYAKNL